MSIEYGLRIKRLINSNESSELPQNSNWIPRAHESLQGRLKIKARRIQEKQERLPQKRIVKINGKRLVYKIRRENGVIFIE